MLYSVRQISRIQPLLRYNLDQHYQSSLTGGASVYFSRDQHTRLLRTVGFPWCVVLHAQLHQIDQPSTWLVQIIHNTSSLFLNQIYPSSTKLHILIRSQHAARPWPFYHTQHAKPSSWHNHPYLTPSPSDVSSPSLPTAFSPIFTRVSLTYSPSPFYSSTVCLIYILNISVKYFSLLRCYISN